MVAIARQRREAARLGGRGGGAEASNEPLLHELRDEVEGGFCAKFGLVPSYPKVVEAGPPSELTLFAFSCLLVSFVFLQTPRQRGVRAKRS